MASSGGKPSSGSPKGVDRPSKPVVRKTTAPAQSSLPKVLRIGIIQGGKIIEERIIRRRETVTVGPSEKAHFVFAAQDLPSSRFELFETKGEEYTLNFTETMSGRISLEGAVAELADLRKSGKARAKGKVWQLPLSDQARGKIAVGESTILFQFVAPPPMQPRPQLPAAVKGNLLANAINFSSVCILFFLILEAGLCIWWANTDWPKPNMDEEFKRLQELIQPRIAKVEEEKKVEADTGKTEDDKKAEDDKAKKKKTSKEDWKEDETPKKSADEIARERAEKRAQLAEALAQTGINKILGALGGDGAIADVMRGGDVGADQDELLAQVSGVGVATGEDGALHGPAGGKGSGEAADISQIKVKGDKDVATEGPGAERQIKGTVKKKNPTAAGGSGMLEPGEVAGVVNRRIGAIKGCYEQALKRDPTLQGKITIRFTISGSGKVSDAKCIVNELPPAVCSCVQDSFLRFRFPPPEGGAVTFEYPFLFTPAG
jgi:outer membrane biosynthesis protein TonB